MVWGIHQQIEAIGVNCYIPPLLARSTGAIPSATARARPDGERPIPMPHPPVHLTGFDVDVPPHGSTTRNIVPAANRQQLLGTTRAREETTAQEYVWAGCTAGPRPLAQRDTGSECAAGRHEEIV